MGLFTKFEETVFYKVDSELERKVEILTELQKKYPNNDKIKSELAMSKAGLKGENQIIFELKNANIGMYVLHDITIRGGDSTAQIDFVVITPYKNYFIECKDMIGDITVNNTGQFIRKFESDGKVVKKSIYSPLTQAERHIDIFLKNWNSRHNSIQKFLYRKSVEKFNVPLVVMANSEGILDTRFAPKELKNKIIRADQLVKYIKDDIKSAASIDLCGKKLMEEIAETFKSLDQPVEKDYEKLLVKNDDYIKNKLIEFRKSKAEERKIPEDYIFTDDELDSILSIMPKELNELNDILSEIKVKYHGQEIIDIINN